jgi:uncharacterized metal-binding protein YceD (DUF177 family)
MSRKPTDSFIDAVFRVDRVPAAGREITVAADAEERAGLAERLEVSAVEMLKADLTASRFRGGLRVEGRLEARIVQPCVVTFEPVTQEIDERIDRIFLPASQRPHQPEPGSETFVDLEGEDPPDYIDGPEIDVSELLVETLSLAIDPYPRAPGADLDALGVNDDKAETSPFARLKALKPKPDDR